MFKGLFLLISGIIRLTFFTLLFTVIFHTWVIKQLLTYSLRHVLGTEVLIQEVKMDWRNTGFEVRNLDIINPEGFPRDRLADIPLVIVSVDLDSLRRGKIRLKALGLNLRELQVMNVPMKGLNVLELKPIQKAKEAEGSVGALSKPRSQDRAKSLDLFIDELIFSVGEITYLDMRSGVAKKSSFHAGIRGATYYDIQGADDMVVIVVTEALKKMGFVFLNTQIQKIRDRYLSSPPNSEGFFNRAVSFIKEKLSGP
ncbi:MAG: AsmA family protein [Candidatus Omnitrophica bacterium]|nr:AsmA family protein [Candidatus Omnitrophota bacterium]